MINKFQPRQTERVPVFIGDLDGRPQCRQSLLPLLAEVEASLNAVARHGYCQKVILRRVGAMLKQQKAVGGAGRAEPNLVAIGRLARASDQSEAD